MSTQMPQFNLSEWKALLDRMDFDHVQATTLGDNILSNDVPDQRVAYLVALILSDTSGSANTANVDKVEEDDTVTTVIPSINLKANETLVLSALSLGIVFPRLEGNTNIQVTAGANNVESTLYYVQDEV